MNINRRDIFWSMALAAPLPPFALAEGKVLPAVSARQP